MFNIDAVHSATGRPRAGASLAGRAQDLLSFAVFVGFTLVLVLVPWPRDR